MLQHGVEHDQQLSHARGEHDLRGFPGRAQALGERANDGIAARRHERAHIEDGADLGAPAPDGARSSPRPAVPIQGGHPHQRGDLFAGQRAEFRQRRQQRRRQHRPDAGRAPQERLLLAPHRTVVNGLRQIAIRLREFPFEPGDVGAQTCAPRLTGMAEAVLLRRQHLDELPAAREERRQEKTKGDRLLKFYDSLPAS